MGWPLGPLNPGEGYVGFASGTGRDVAEELATGLGGGATDASGLKVTVRWGRGGVGRELLLRSGELSVVVAISRKGSVSWWEPPKRAY